MKKDEMARVTRLARVLHITCSLILVLIPVVVGIALSLNQLGAEDLRQDYADYLIPEVVPLGSVIAIRAMEGLGVVITLYVFWQMRTLFGFYKSGETLTARCAFHILRIGQGLVAIGTVGFVSNTISILILTWNNPPGSRTLSVGFTDGDLGFLMAGGLIMVIGWVMGEAARIAEDNRGFV